jgi:hypothetical protein
MQERRLRKKAEQRKRRKKNSVMGPQAGQQVRRGRRAADPIRVCRPPRPAPGSSAAALFLLSRPTSEPTRQVKVALDRRRRQVAALPSVETREKREGSKADGPRPDGTDRLESTVSGPSCQVATQAKPGQKPPSACRRVDFCTAVRVCVLEDSIDASRV